MSLTDWERVLLQEGEDIDMSDIPEVTEEQLAQAVLRVDGKPVPRGKVQVNMYLDAAVVAYFKAQAGGRGYQTLINEVRFFISKPLLTFFDINPLPWYNIPR